MSIDMLLGRLDGVRTRGNSQWSCKCPAHADRSPSLSIKEAPDGTILIRCFAGCEPNDILGAIGMNIRDLFPKALARNLPKKRMGLSPWDALRATRHEAWVLTFVAEEIARGAATEALCRRAQLAAERVRTALSLCDG